MANPPDSSSSPLTAAFYTLGCKLNQVETEAAAAAFLRSGFPVAEYPEPADLTIINTCTVTSKGEQKARRVIRKILRDQPGAVVLATGCYVQMEPEAVGALGDRVVTLSQDLKDRLMDLPPRLAEFRGGGDLLAFLRTWAQETAAETAPLGTGAPLPAGSGRFRFNLPETPFRTRAFLKIQDGCANRCAYCRVTLARGEPVSLPADQAVEQLRALAAAGYREVVLTGINLACYRSPDGPHECEKSPGSPLVLAGLLRRMLRETSGPRIRLSSLEPEMITPDLAEVLAEPRICPHFHLSVQAGSDAVLKAMRRRYRRDRVVQAVRDLRQARENPLLAADMIAGFPGETEEDFQESLGLLRELGFGALHVFPFSPRPGTEAASMKPPVPSAEIRERAARLRRLDGELRRAYAAGLEGRPAEAVVEEAGDTGGGTGLTGEYQEVRLPGNPWGTVVPGELYRGRLTAASSGLILEPRGKA